MKSGVLRNLCVGLPTRLRLGVTSFGPCMGANTHSILLRFVVRSMASSLSDVEAPASAAGRAKPLSVAVLSLIPKLLLRIPRTGAVVGALLAHLGLSTWLRSLDAPAGFASTCERQSTVTPTQALLLVNGDWTLARAQKLEDVTAIERLYTTAGAMVQASQDVSLLDNIDHDTALREIADETVDLELLREGLIKGLQKHVEADEPEEDTLDVLPRPEFGADGARLDAESLEGFQTVDEDSEDGFPGADFSEDGEDEASTEES
mgnify:CR=1 FL=1